MRLKVAAAVIAIIGAVAILAAPASAQTSQPQTKKKRVVYTNRGNTVFINRDEDGRTRTRIIVQKRSYLDPGTERFPGERSDYDYVQMPNQRASSVLDNTTFGGSQSALPNLWTLPSKNNPFMQY
jgi:hypothetical protein